MAEPTKPAEAKPPAAEAKKTAAKPQTTTAVIAPEALAPKQPTGIFDEVKRIDEAVSRGQGGAGERHTFGQWARAKGVRVERIAQLVREKKLDISNTTGDGPEMTEAEFDAAVHFELKNTFGASLPPMRTHIPADVTRGTAGFDTAEGQDAKDDAEAAAAAKRNV